MVYNRPNQAYFGDISDLGLIQRVALPLFGQMGIGAEQWKKRSEFLEKFNDPRFGGVDPLFLSMAAYFKGVGEQTFSKFMSRITAEQQDISEKGREFLRVMKDAAITGMPMERFICQLADFYAESEQLRAGSTQQRYIM